MRTGVGRVEQAALGHSGRELGRNHAGFHHGIEIFLVDLENPVQFVRQNDEAVAFRRDDAAGQVGARTAHRDGQIAVIGEFDDFAQLLLIGGADHQGGQHRGKNRGVVRIRQAVGFFRQNVLCA